MILDIILAIIVLICLIAGFKRGFVHTFSHTLGWVISLLAAFFGATPLRTLISKHTGIYDAIYQHFFDKFDTSTGDITTYIDALPKMFQTNLDDMTSDIIETLATDFADLLSLVLCFIAIFIAAKLILFVIMHAFSKKYRKGFTGFFDGLLGLIAGGITGIILVFIILTLLIPGTEFLAPDKVESISKIMDSSYISRTLYDNNFMVVLEDSVFSKFFS